MSPTDLNMAPLALLLLFVFAAIWFVATYNTLVRLRNYCRESWSQVDTELQRRYDLIPNLVRTVQGYARHEQQTLELLTRARSRAAAAHGSPESQAREERELVGHLRHVLAVAESYPDLKADAHFLQLQEELTNTEDRIQAARRFYNANVRDYNTRTEVLPSNMVAAVFGFGREEYFNVEETGVRSAPRVESATEKGGNGNA